MPTVKDILIKAREIIALPEHWTKHASARDSSGRTCAPSSPAAYSFCMGGAVDRARALLGSPQDPDSPYRALQNLTRHDYANYTRWNDAEDRSHGAVLSLLDQAIAAA